MKFRGTISGAVTDPTGATIAGAKITVTETHTGVATSVVSGSTGQYTALFLLSGDYEITARLPGFKDALRKGVHIGAGDHPVIDIRLDVGDAAQTVEVNRPTFAFPNLAPTNSAFGLITGQSNRSRSMQLGGRLVF